MVTHFRVIRDHQKHIKKIAVVTDSHMGDVAEHLASHFVSAEVRHFPAGQVEQARQWIIPVKPGHPVSAAAGSAGLWVRGRQGDAFDVSDPCAGMLTGATIATNWIRHGNIERALVVSGEYISRLGAATQPSTSAPSSHLGRPRLEGLPVDLASCCPVSVKSAQSQMI